MNRCRAIALLLACLFLLPEILAVALRAGDLDDEPIRYSKTPDDNVVSRLRADIESGKVHLKYEPKWGYLQSLLRQLHVPTSSQTLVFSKTSLQRQRISPEKPRAIYFNDNVYVGCCQDSELVEVATTDPRLGTAFYSFMGKKSGKPQLMRQGDACLTCHAASYTNNFPAPLVRSVFADSDGLPALSMGTHVIDHTSPLAERWGGWYVTGKCGRQTHLGNFIVHDEKQPEEVNNKAGVNRCDLKGICDARPYLTPYSDIVALMVLEHQTAAHALMTRANFLTRTALRDAAEINKALGRPANYRSDSTLGRIKNAGEPLVKYLFFCGETPLTDSIEGPSAFAREFTARGPRDHKGRSLRDFDLHKRMFRYPLSYLIYSRAFDQLPGPVHEYVAHRLCEVLSGQDTNPDSAHLTSADRKAILEILRDTKPELLRDGARKSS